MNNASKWLVLATLLTTCDACQVSNVADLGQTGSRPPSAVVNTNNPSESGDGGNAITLPNEGGCQLGMAVLIDQPEDTVYWTPGKATELNSSQVAGVVASISGDQVTAQNTGVVELSTADWDAVAGTAGGLSPNVVYYLSSATFGFLTSVPPSSTGSYVARVGIAVSPTQLLLLFSYPIGPHA
jgi:hypothetical protein